MSESNENAVFEENMRNDGTPAVQPRILSWLVRLLRQERNICAVAPDLSAELRSALACESATD